MHFMFYFLKKYLDSLQNVADLSGNKMQSSEDVLIIILVFYYFLHCFYKNRPLPLTSLQSCNEPPEPDWVTLLRILSDQFKLEQQHEDLSRYNNNYGNVSSKFPLHSDFSGKTLEHCRFTRWHSKAGL